MAAIEECNDLAPLHNPANLIGIRACQAHMPSVPMVAVFDTAFHQTMPDKAYTYAIPYEYYENYKIRRYGFHGTSHSFVSKKTGRAYRQGYRKIPSLSYATLETDQVSQQLTAVSQWTLPWDSHLLQVFLWAQEAVI